MKITSPRKKCHVDYIEQCNTYFSTKYDHKCDTSYEKKCHTRYDTKYSTKYDKKCHIEHEEKCHGYGYHQKCRSYPKEYCEEVPVKVPHKVSQIVFDKNIFWPKIINYYNW